MACGKCVFPIRENEPARHYGFFSAHLESECLRLLKDRIAELTEQLDELLTSLKAVEADLVQRAEFDMEDGGAILNISNGVLQKMHAAIAKAEK